MPNSGLLVFVVDDDGAVTRALVDQAPPGARVSAFPDGDAVAEALRDSATPAVDATFIALKKPGAGALEAVSEARQARPDSEVVLVSGDASLEAVVQAMRAGATDFLTRPMTPAQARAAFERLRTARAVRQRSRGSDATRLGPESLIGGTAEMERVRDLIKRVAPEDVTVLIRGESGTGKDLVARAIHAGSSRSTRPFVTVDCGAIARNLIESELFGHEKGAFTGAIARKDGLFLRADGGTLFLDEIGEIPIDLQPTILRAIEEKKFRPVGGTQLISSDVRIISATNRDLEKAIEGGAFRLDLYYRLNVVQIVLPHLRRRRDDIPLLAEAFVQRLAGDGRHRKVTGVSRDAMEELMRYEWPGNVRELENVIEQAVTLGRHAEIEVEDLPPRIVSPGDREPARAASTNLLRPLVDIEKDAILAALQSSRGDTKAVSQILDIDRSTLYRKMKRFGIEVSQFKR